MENVGRAIKGHAWRALKEFVLDTGIHWESMEGYEERCHIMLAAREVDDFGSFKRQEMAQGFYLSTNNSE